MIFSVIQFVLLKNRWPCYNKIKHQKAHTFEIIPKANRKIVVNAKPIPPAHMYMTAHFVWLCAIVQQRIAVLSYNLYNTHSLIKKSLKIPKKKSEFVHRRRTDNALTKRKSKKGQTTIYKTYTYNLRSSNTNLTKNRW